MIMIILSSKKYNTDFKKTIQFYLNTVNFCHIECPNCGSHDLIRWGYYERNAIFFSDSGMIVESKLLKIQRVRCKSCDKTHALLPFGIIPYKQFTDEVISEILLEISDNTLDYVLNTYQISQSTIEKWDYQYNQIHKSKINTLIKQHNSIEALRKFVNTITNRLNYINNYNLCFMQIKLGCLGLCPS